jgi:cytochrome c biogenesis protein CcmG/thiol:disulfide interchange protein DsbE
MTKRPPASRKPPAGRPSPGKSPAHKAAPVPAKKPLWLWAAIVGIIALALGIAVWSTTGNDKKVTEGSVVTGNSISTPAETQPVTMVGTALPPPPDSGADTAIGLTAPTLHGFTFDGSPIDITPDDGRAKMVVFLAHWCPHCNNEIPVILRWAESGGVPPNLDIIGVSTAVSPDRDNYPPSKWIVAKGWKYPVMADSAHNDAERAYGVASFPTFTIVGSDGKVKLRSSGELAETQLDGLVTQALTG